MVEVRRINDWILSLKMVFKQETFSIISAYAPQLGLEEHEKIKFEKISKG